jgi:capsular exopolysaccharide synthesis family protein
VNPTSENRLSKPPANQPDPLTPAAADGFRAVPAAATGFIPPSRAAWGKQGPESAIPLSQYLWAIRRYRWRILTAIAVSVIGTAIVSSRITPIFESTATIDIDRRSPTDVLGPQAMQSSTNDADQFLSTQIKVLQSDSVLRPVAKKYNLRELEDENWVEEGLKNTEAEDTPVILKKLKIVRPANTSLLLVSYRSKDKNLAANVANGVAESYLEHAYNVRYKAAAGLSTFMEKQQEELRAKMERSSEALAAFERQLSVINPEEKTSILSSRLMQLNTEYTTAQGDRVKRQAAYESITTGSMDAAQVSSQSEALKKLNEAYNEAEQRFEDVRSRFGVNYPEYKRAAAQLEAVKKQLETTKDSIRRRVQIEYNEAVSREKMLERAVAETKAEFDRINLRSSEYQTLKREADADKKLYEELVRKIKEASINASFQNSAIRIEDPARPGLKPISPNLKLNVALAFLLSLFVSVAAALVADGLDNTIRDPEQVERTLHTPVIGTLPRVKTWRTQTATVLPDRQVDELAAADTGNGHTTVLKKDSRRSLTSYEEAIRTLRNSVMLSEFERQFRTLLVTSAAPSEGKSTIAIHLAVAHAQQHYKTLLIDGDMRRPSIHKGFGISNSVGLSDVLLDSLPWRSALVHPEGIPDLEVMPAGSISGRAADLIGRGLQRLLDELSREYDLIILDAPPLLGFPEPLQMAAAVDGVIIVARAGQTSRNGVATVISTLKRLRANVVGLVLNEVHKEVSNSYYYYGYYGKYYKHYNEQNKS